MRYWYLPSKT